MRILSTCLLAMVLVPAPASAGPAYINSRGDLVELRPAPEQEAAEFVRAGLITPAGAVFEVPGTPRRILLDRGVIVKVREGVSIPIKKLLAPAGLIPVGEIGRTGAMIRCEARDAAAALAGSKAAAAMPEVMWAVPDFIFPVTLAHRPNDPYYIEQWYHYQPSGAHMHCEEAWDVTMGDPRVIVAVFDTGMDMTHPDFGPGQLLTAYNANDGSTDVTPDPGMYECHGTGCAGLIAASADNGEGMAGVCPQCSLLPAKLGADYQNVWGAAAAYYHFLDRGAWVSSNSWGVLQEYADQMDLEPVYQAIRDFIAQAREGRGGVALFSSGNEGRPIGPDELPNLPEVMAVGGTDYTDKVVSYSCYGPNLSVVAPTGTLDLNRPMIIATDVQGDGGMSRDGYFWSWTPEGEAFNTGFPEPDATGNYTRHFSGTSAANPIAAGVVALTFSANPDLTGTQARLIVENTADKVGDVPYDWGGHHDKYGYGRVNAARAVRAAQIGFDNPGGAQCAENLNCTSGICKKTASSDPLGRCFVNCSGLSDGVPCHDSDECTANDACSGGVCSGTPLTCDDYNPCTDDSCDPATGCVHTDNQSPCDDNDPCTEYDACKNGACTGTPATCDDYNPCTDDSCDPATGCTHTNNQSSCEDGDPCTEGDTCNQGNCISGNDTCEEGCGCGGFHRPGSPQGGHHHGPLSLLLLLGIALLALTRKP